MTDNGNNGAGTALAPSSEALTSAEQYTLHAHEQVIERGIATFHEVGTALLAIRDGRLYRSTHATFEDYCQTRWSMSKTHANRLIDASEVMNRLTPIGVTPPDNEAQVRELAKMVPEAQAAAWAAAVETAPDGKVTANHIATVAFVFDEMLRTGTIDPGDGIAIAKSDILKAAITEEAYERMMRQRGHIVESVEKKSGRQKPKTNRAGDENEAMPFDSCQTPAYALDPLLPYLDNNWIIWECASGQGLLVSALHQHGFPVEFNDINGLGMRQHNFFDWEPEHWDCLVTNPPYSIKYKWLERCYDLGKPFALLLPVETLGAKTAQVLFRTHGVQVLFMDQHINFKMPEKGFDGSGAQFPTAWFTWQLDLETDMVFAHVNPH